MSKMRKLVGGGALVVAAGSAAAAPSLMPNAAEYDQLREGVVLCAEWMERTDRNTVRKLEDPCHEFRNELQKNVSERNPRYDVAQVAAFKEDELDDIDAMERNADIAEKGFQGSVAALSLLGLANWFRGWRLNRDVECSDWSVLQDLAGRS